MAISSALGSTIGAVPTGCVLPFAGTAEPSGWLLCYGQAISRTQYSALFALIGTTYGNGDGSTTFNVPDLRGRVIAGQDDMGGTSANRLTNPAATTGGIDGDVLGGTGGSETHLLTGAQSGTSVHGHTASSGNQSADHSHQSNYTFGAWGAGIPSGMSVGDAFGADGSLATGGQSANHTHTITVVNSFAADASSAHNNVQPTIILNYIIKV